MLTNHKQLLHRVTEDIMVDKIIVNHHSWTLGRPDFLKNLPDTFFWNPWSMYERP